MNAMEQDMTRFKRPVMAVGGGIAAALVIATLPHVYLESVIGMTGLAEIIPAAAPPLGNTARGLVAVMTGLVATSALYLVLNHKTHNFGGGSDMSLAIRRNLTQEPIEETQEGASRFTMPKLNLSAKSLTKFLKKPKKSARQVTELRDLPDVRPADRHPDAPARPPIFASSDLGPPLADQIKPFDQAEVEQEPAEQSAEPAIKSAPFVADKVLHSPTEDQPAPDPSETAGPQEDQPAAPREDLSALSLAQLADRLETGLRRLEALEKGRQIEAPKGNVDSASVSDKTVAPDAVVEAPGPVVEASAPLTVPPLRSVDSPTEGEGNRQADMDAALKAALGTLERMTVQR